MIINFVSAFYLHYYIVLNQWAFTHCEHVESKVDALVVITTLKTIAFTFYGKRIRMIKFRFLQSCCYVGVININDWC